MQVVHDIFSIWGADLSKAARALAAALDEKHDTVYRWGKRGRIPGDAFPGIVEAARLKGKILTLADLHAANRPRKARRPAHKRRSMRRRSESGVDA